MLDFQQHGTAWAPSDVKCHAAHLQPPWGCVEGSSVFQAHNGNCSAGA